MKYALRLTPLNKPVASTVLNPVVFNGIPEKAELFEKFMACCHDKNYSIRTREAYWGWVRRFILFHRKRDPLEMGLAEIEQFLAWLDTQGRVTASTRNQALSALLFFYRNVLNLHSAWMENAARIKLPSKPCVPLTADEVKRVLSRLNGNDWLIASLLYGTGLQVMECIRLRVKDVSIQHNEISVRDARGELVKRLKVPSDLHLVLKAHMEKTLEKYGEDMKRDWQGAYMPELLLINYPNVGKTFAWQYVFAAERLPHDPCDGKIRRYHRDEREFQRALADAGVMARVDKPVSSQALGNSLSKHRPFRSV